jgi:DNA-binding MarR family transcriptional regulator
LTRGKVYLHIIAMQSNLAECADCLCLASRRAARQITRTFDRELRPYGLRATQFTVLVMLSLRGAMTIGELAEALGVERTTLTRNLALLEEASWVKCQRAEKDARSRTVTVTENGRAIVARAFLAWRRAQDITAGAIGSSGAAALRRLARAALRVEQNG